jgi:hypothetical protein
MLPVPAVAKRVKFKPLFHTTSPYSPLSLNMSTKKMRAILIKDGKGPIENLYIGETATPVVKSQEVLVKVRTVELGAPYCMRLSRHNA